MSFFLGDNYPRERESLLWMPALHELIGVPVGKTTGLTGFFSVFAHLHPSLDTWISNPTQFYFYFFFFYEITSY